MIHQRYMTKIPGMLLALYGLSAVGMATPQQMQQAVSQIRKDNVRDSRHRGYGPWVTRSAGWRQSQRRKGASRPKPSGRRRKGLSRKS